MAFSSKMCTAPIRNRINRGGVYLRMRIQTLFLAGILIAAALMGLRAMAQSPEVQQRLADVKAASAQNKQALATYTWQEQDTISLKGEVKKQESYQVRMGPDGKPLKHAAECPGLLYP